MKTKNCLQLDVSGYVIGFTVADESPLEPGVFLFPAGAINAEMPTVPDGMRARWNGGSFVFEAIPVPPAVDPDPVPVPTAPLVVSRFQARAALYLAGLLDDVEALMAAPETPALAKLAWADAQEFKRNSPTVISLSSSLGLTEAQLDELFTTAAGIEA